MKNKFENIYNYTTDKSKKAVNKPLHSNSVDANVMQLDQQ